MKKPMFVVYISLYAHLSKEKENKFEGLDFN